MSTSIMPPAAVGQDEPLSEDLETTACQAAIELDNLVIGSSQNAGSIQKLAERLTTELPEAKDLSSIKHLVAPSTVIVMSGAIRELHEPLKQNEVQELTQAIRKIAQRLSAVSSNPVESRRDIPALERLRHFCLVLSKLAAAAHGSAIEPKPQHPYRKQG
ncbi:MAG TPA: hypothetical protein VEL76_36860 [Gemmataceae bacterium]|nr:hypothetical protein [Gemmataceae bacterium]